MIEAVANTTLATPAGTGGIQSTPATFSTAAAAATATTVTESGATPPSSNKAYGVVLLTLENVLLPKDKVSPTPSALDGLDNETEMDLRIAGCELISSSGILLRLPQTAMATGQVLFQRFYYSKSFIRQPMEVTAMACVYLASKIEEAPRRIRDVINVFHHIKQLRAGKTVQPMILDPSYIRLKSDVTLAERRVLKELGFCVHVKHPHKLIVVYLQQLGYDRESSFVQMSWNYMSDALRSNVFVRYAPEAIACACIFLSGRQLKIPLPNSPAWYIVFDVTEEIIIDVCESILELYERPKISYEQLDKKVDTLIKMYQESRQKSKTGSIVDRLNAENSSAASPSSRTSSPTTKTATSVPAAKSKDLLDIEKKDKRKNGDSDHSGRRSAANTPETKKPRRSPSPIVFGDSPQRSHKKKKRRKSRSESSSPSRSKERRSIKKHGRRERSRSRSPYSPKRQHKQSKSHHRDRYRSRSYSPIDREREDRYDRGYEKQYYKKSSKSSKSTKERDEDSVSSIKNRSRDKDRR